MVLSDDWLCWKMSWPSWASYSIEIKILNLENLAGRKWEGIQRRKKINERPGGASAFI